MIKAYLKAAFICVLGIAAVPPASAKEPGQGGMNTNTPRSDAKLGSKESNQGAAKPGLNSNDLKMKPNDKLGSKEPAAAGMNNNQGGAKPGLGGADLKVKPNEKLGSKEPAK